MFDLTKYVNEINAIAMENDMAWDIGRDMFINNIEDAEMANDKHFYHGADEVDYKALKVEWDKLSAQEKADAKNAYNAWYRARI